MNAQNSNHQIAMDLISQYGDDAESIAMLGLPNMLLILIQKSGSFGKRLLKKYKV